MKTKIENTGMLSSLIDEIDPKTARNIENKMLLAARIADLMDAKGISKTNLANKLGKHASEISKWLSGTHNFTIETLWDIEEVVGGVFVKLEEDLPQIQTSRVVITVNYPVSVNSENIFVDHPATLLEMS